MSSIIHNLKSAQNSIWDLEDLTISINKYNEYQQYPYLDYLPKQINLDFNFWKEMKNLYTLTLRDEHERLASVFFIDNELIITKNLTNKRLKLKDENHISVRYIPQKKSLFALKEILIDGVVCSSHSVETIPQTNNIKVSHLFNLFTYKPKYFNGSRQEQDRYYNFFRLSDLKAFVASANPMIGLVTDEFWLLVKTSESPKYIPEFEDNEINIDILSRYFKYGIYVGQFDQQKLVCLNR